MSDLHAAPLTRSPFADGLAQGVLRYQCCATCGTAQTLTRHACTRCGGHDLPWRDAAGTGTVFACSVIHRAPSEEFRARVPYTLLLVDLDEGPRVMAQGAAGLVIGQRVRVRVQPHAGRHLPAFEPEAPR